MKMQTFLVILFNILLFQSVFGQEVEHEEEFDYGTGQKGPTNWWRIKPEWFLCGNGSMQSPINISSEIVKQANHLSIKRKYKKSNATLINRGHDMMLQWVDGAGSIKINGTSYLLNQVHWHSPAEHQINCQKFAMEAHMVHQSSDKKVAVVSILHKLGKPNSFLSKLEGELKSVSGTSEKEIQAGKVKPESVKFHKTNYYTYVGSLTVPPCSENVLWIIPHKIASVTEEQLELLRVAVHDDSDTNARPVQLVNNRTVLVHMRGKKSN